MKAFFKTIVIVIGLVVVTNPLFAEVPHLISYQGKLGDAQGTPLTGAHNITFRIYDAEVAGSLKWSEAHTGVVVNNGYFSLMLGSITALDLPFDQPYWLSIQVGGDPEMTPRQRIASVGYSYRAERAEYSLAEDLIVRGFDVTYKGLGDLYVEPGILFNGDTRVKKTSRTTLTLANDSDWIDGSKPALLANLWVYVYCDVDGNLKLRASAPNKADSEGNTDGKKFYYASGSNYYRWLGQVRTNASGNIIKFYTRGDWVYYDDMYGNVDLRIINASGTNITTWTAVSCANQVPATSQLTKLNSHIAAYNSAVANFRTTGSSASNGIYWQIRHVGGGSDTQLATTIEIPLSSSQSLDYKAWYDATYSGKFFIVYVVGYYDPKN